MLMTKNSVESGGICVYNHGLSLYGGEGRDQCLPTSSVSFTRDMVSWLVLGGDRKGTYRDAAHNFFAVVLFRSLPPTPPPPPRSTGTGKLFPDTEKKDWETTASQNGVCIHKLNKERHLLTLFRNWSMIVDESNQESYVLVMFWIISVFFQFLVDNFLV